MISGYQLLFEAEVVKGAAVSRLNGYPWAQMREALRQVAIAYGKAVEPALEGIRRFGAIYAEALRRERAR